MKTNNLILIGALLLTLLLFHRSAVKKQILKALNEQQVGFAAIIEGHESTISNLRLNLKASHELITKLKKENDIHLKGIDSITSLSAIPIIPAIPAIPSLSSRPSSSSLPSHPTRKKVRLGDKRDICVELCSSNNENMNYFSCLETCAKGNPTPATAASSTALIAHHNDIQEESEKYNGISMKGLAEEVKIVEEDGLLNRNSFKLGLSNETMIFALRYMKDHGIPVKEPELIYKTSVWLIAADIYNYESPLMDLNLVASSEGKGVIDKFSILPKSYLAINRQAIINNYWLSSGSKIGLKHFWQRCIQKVNPRCIPGNTMFCQTDAAILYGQIMYWRPKRVLEIGSGFSSIVVGRAYDELTKALKLNDTSWYSHTIIEPFRMDVIDSALIKKQIPARHKMRRLHNKVQMVPLSEFDALESGDILFIDSSHVLQPYGDSIFEFMHILPRLKKGVIVHVHDIFLPFDYPTEWMKFGKRQYTEQWLLAAFLHKNEDWEIIWPSFLMFLHYQELGLEVVELNRDKGGSFWFRRIKG